MSTYIVVNYVAMEEGRKREVEKFKQRIGRHNKRVVKEIKKYIVANNNFVYACMRLKSMVGLINIQTSYRKQYKKYIIKNKKKLKRISKRDKKKSILKKYYFKTLKKLLF